MLLQDMKIVFLDIDGVLQPYFAERRYREFPNAKKIITELSEKHNIDYFQYHVYDVLAVYFDWKKIAVERLKTVLDETDSKIIVSSNWRSKREPNKMHDLLAIHDLDDYWFCDNEIIIRKHMTEWRIRQKEIKISLKEYPIINYVVVDDMSQLIKYFRDNCVITRDYMSEEDKDNCIKILKRK